MWSGRLGVENPSWSDTTSSRAELSRFAGIAASTYSTARESAPMLTATKCQRSHSYADAVVAASPA